VNALSISGPTAGNLTGSGLPQGSTVSHYALGVVPEPSTALLGALGTLILLRRRRNG
jgi:hypothetical protein